MKRLLTSYLLEWKESPNRKPLILRGARQVGKTYLIDKLGKSSFKYYLKVNPEKDPSLQYVFQHKNPQLIINELTALYNIPIIENETLLFIDEVQVLPDALAALRYFYEEMPRLHIVAAGSLLDHILNEIPFSMPVGRVEFAYLQPMNFVEFLMANNENGLVQYLEAFQTELTFSEAIHLQLLNWLRLYYFIGGMPEAVKMYSETKQLQEVEKVHASILTSFQYDFSKYGTRKLQEYLYDSMVYSAGNVGHKIKYTNIHKTAHSSYIKDALQKLEWSRIINLVRRTGSSKVPINQYVDKDFYKPIFLDIGLLCHLGGIKLSDIDSLTTNFEGTLAEQFVGQELLTTFSFFEDPKLYFWARENKSASAEIDFLLQIRNKIYPIEVKSGKSGTLKSLQVYLKKKNQTDAIRFNTDLPSYGKNLSASINIKGEVGELTYNLLSLPLYLSYFVRQLV